MLSTFHRRLFWISKAMHVTIDFVLFVHLQCIKNKLHFCYLDSHVMFTSYWTHRSCAKVLPDACGCVGVLGCDRMNHRFVIELPEYFSLLRVLWSLISSATLFPLPLLFGERADVLLYWYTLMVVRGALSLFVWMCLLSVFRGCNVQPLNSQAFVAA